MACPIPLGTIMTNSKPVSKYPIIAGHIFVMCNDASSGLKRMTFITFTTISYISYIYILPFVQR